MTVALEEFQKDAQTWLARLRETGETLLLTAGREAFELRPASSPRAPTDQVPWPKRDIIVGDPEELVHLDWSSAWRP